MSVFTPGALILWCPSGSNLPRWPAVVCLDNMAPDSFLKTRPAAYVTLILRISDVYTFHWAYTAEIHEYDPCAQFNPNNSNADTPGLGEAFAIADSALDAGLGLNHWTSEFKRQTAIVIASDDEQTWSDFQDLEDESDSDPGLSWAIRESRKCPEAHSPATNEKSCRGNGEGSSSRCSQLRRQLTDEFSFQGNSESSLPSQAHSCPARIISQRNAKSVTTSSKRTLGRTPTAELPSSVRFPLENPSGDLLGLDRLGQSFAAPTSDVVEGELTTSREFVHIKVGEEERELVLPMSCVWNRPYFRDGRAGVMHFAQNEGHLWELNHPGLSDVEPDHFVFAAEFLESGEFGLRVPVGKDENKASFTQCRLAWAVADTLGMIDMMDHIVDKLEERIELDLWDTMVFACRFYEDMGVSLPAHDRLKDFLATYLAENFWIYIRDLHFSSVFIDRIQNLPELEHDIYVRRTLALSQQLQSDDGDEDGDDNDEENTAD